MCLIYLYVLFFQLQKFKKDRVSNHKVEDETDEIKKIKKVGAERF